MAQSNAKNRFARDAKAVAAAERSIQKRIDRQERRQGKKKPSTRAMQAGARQYPAPPLPKQHLAKPGREADLQVAPMFDNPHYLGSEKLKGKVALVTGGDSGMSGDVADPAFCRDAVARTIKQFRRLDVLVNNAAFQEHVTALEDLTDEHFDRTLKTNLYGYFYMAKAAVPHMKPGSAVVMTGSVTGLLGNAKLLDYSMTKGGIHAFVRSLATHLIDKGIRVNAVAPGPVWTPLNPADRDAEGVSKFGSQTPMKRPAQPEEIAPAFVFLAAPTCSSYITGEILPIIGGYSGG